MARIVLVEAMPAIRQCLASLLERMGHTVVGSVADGRQGLALVRRCRPDLSILALSTPGMSGLDLVRRVRRSHSAGLVLVYSALSAEQFAPQCLKEGVNGFVSKLEELEVLEAAIDSVLKGHSHYPSVALEAADGGELASLSPRELSVLQLIAEGKSNQEIADLLSISFKTVSTHKTHMQEKLHVFTRLDLAELARRLGLVEPRGKDGFQAVEESSAWSQQVLQLRAMLDTVGNPMYLRDQDGRLLLCNQSFLDFYHVSAEEVANTDFQAAWWFDDAERFQIGAAFKELVRGDEPFSIERTLTVRGEARLLQLWGMPFRDSGGQVIGIVGGVRDLTEQAQVMARLRSERRLSEVASEAQLTLFRSILAEFNEALVRAREDDDATQALDTLGQLAARVGRLAELASSDSSEPQVPSDLLQFTGTVVSQHRLVVSTARSVSGPVWIALETYRELLNLLCQMAGADAVVELVQRQTSHGIIDFEMTLWGQLPYRSLSPVLIRTAEMLAEHLGGHLEHVVSQAVPKFVVILELEQAMPTLQRAPN